MTKFQMLTAAAVAVMAAACAGTQSTENASDSTTSTAARTSTATTEQSGMPAQATQSAAITDAQIRSYVAARSEVEPLQASLAAQTPEQQTQTRAQIAAILQRNNLNAETFNQIAQQANADRTFAARLASAQPNTFSDQTLRSFAAASIEIDPISRGLATATPEQRTQATEQIRQILQRNNLDSATYNAIASRAQADTAFAARIAQLNTANPSG